MRHAKRGEVNYDAIDGFTAAHAASGAIMALTGVKASTALAMAVGWELVEPVLKTEIPGLFPHASIDTPINKLTDVAAVMVGWWGAKRLSRGR